MADPSPPSAWLADNVGLIARRGRVLDVASGRGRHALFLAARGFHVHAIDRDPHALDTLCQLVSKLQALEGLDDSPGRVTTEVLDLEAGSVSLGHRRYDGIIVFNYLHRPLLPAIVDALVEGGVLIYETFTIGQAERGHPKNPAYLLQAGELEALVAPLRVVRAREGDCGGKLVASVVAVRE